MQNGEHHTWPYFLSFMYFSVVVGGDKNNSIHVPLLRNDLPIQTGKRKLSYVSVVS